MREHPWWSLCVAALLVAAVSAAPAHAQVGKGLLDPNVASEQELSALPHMTMVIVKGILANRPFLSVADLHKYLRGQGLDEEQTTAFYRRAFVHVNLDTGTTEEILLIPGAGKRMAHEFDENRPWKSWAQFDREISKDVQMAEVNRLKQYVFIPIDLNTGTDEDFLTIPNVSARMVEAFKAGRPWKTQVHFEKEIGKSAPPKEVARLWRYVVIPQGRPPTP